MTIPALALLPLLLYISAGYGGQDFKYHVASWLELHQAWRAHEWQLGWSQWAQFGFGEPRFCFYPPLSFLVATALSFLMPFRFVPGVVVWLVLSLSGLAMYGVSAQLVPKQHRLTAAILYMFNPYLIMTIILRFAIAEAWVQALLPLTFFCFFAFVAEARLQAAPAAAGLLAIAWLTNIPEAIALFYGFNLLGLVLSIRARSLRPLIATACVQGAALLLAAYRLLPALREKGWVASQNLLIYDFRSYMQLRRTPPPHLLILLSGAYIALSLILLIPSIRQQVKVMAGWPPLPLALVCLGAFAIALQLPPTTPLWLILPQFRFILFPYRLLPLLALSTVLLLLQAGVARKLQRIAVACLLLFALAPMLLYSRILPMQRFRSLAVATASWQGGYEGVREYVPTAVPAMIADVAHERSSARQGAFHNADCHPALLSDHPNERLVHTASGSSCRLIFNTFYYPFWHATLGDGAPAAVSATQDGLLSIAVPAGAHTVSLRFLPSTATRTWSARISLATLACLSLLALALRRRSPAIFSKPAQVDDLPARATMEHDAAREPSRTEEAL